MNSLKLSRIVPSPLVFVFLVFLAATSSSSAESFGFSALQLPTQASARSMNDSGTIVGYVQTDNGQAGFILNGSQFDEYLINEGSNLTSFNGITADGTIVGWAGASTGFVRTADGTVTVLGTDLIPFGINNSQQVVGFQLGGTGFVYSGGSVTYLYGPDGLQTTLRSINDAGTIVGTFGDSPGVGTGFVLTSGDLVPLIGPNGLGVNPQYINDEGLIVGTLSDGTGFLLANGTYTSITVGGYAFSPISINDSGQILGTYWNGSTTVTGIAAPTPVPEPGSMSLCLFAAVLWGTPRCLKQSRSGLMKLLHFS